MIIIKNATIRASEIQFYDAVSLEGNKLLGFIFPANLTARTFTVRGIAGNINAILRDNFGGEYSFGVVNSAEAQLLIAPQDVVLATEWAEKININLSGALSASDIEVKVLLWDGR